MTMAMSSASHLDDMTDEELIAAERSAACKAATIWFIKKLILLIGLIVLTVIGAYLFQALEQTNELEQCKADEAKYIPLEELTATKLWEIGFSYYANIDISDKEETIKGIEQLVKQFSADVRDLGYDGRNCSLMGTDKGEEFQWSLFGSMLFAVTVYTTVGYGNIAPQTSWGRIVVFAYAMIGIPVMLWCLGAIGAVMADVFRFVYVNICCFGFCARRARQRRRLQQQQEQQPNAQQRLAGNGDDSWPDIYESNVNRNDSIGNRVVVQDDYDDDDDYDESGVLGIPLTVTLCIIFGYIGMGAALFGVWEGWSPMTAAYFCFVTISTIGFGDIVPGAAAKGLAGSADAFKMIVTAIYMIIGMAIISMAFNLIQENMANKAKSISDKITGQQTHGGGMEDDDDAHHQPDQRGPRPAGPHQPPNAPYHAQPPANNWNRQPPPPQGASQNPAQPPKSDQETSFNDKPPSAGGGEGAGN